MASSPLAAPAPLRKGSSALGRVPKKPTTGSYCDHSGWGSKQGSIIKNWKRRYFVLKGLELIYFAERSPSGKGLNEKGRLKVAAVEFTPDFHNALVVFGTLKNQKMAVQFESNDDCKEWMAKIREALQNAAKEAENARKKTRNKVGAAAMEGWLFKEGQNFKTWKKRYMTLTGKLLQYSEAQGEPPKGEVRVQSVNINKSRKFALDIYSDNNRILRIAGDSFETIEAWDRALARAIRRAPCFGESFSSQPAPFLGMDSKLDTDCDGWMYMCGQRSLSWKKRYFTLKATVLQYADHPGENSKGEGSVIDLKLGFKDSQLEIKLDDGKWISVAIDSDEEYDKWLTALCDVLDRIPSMLERVSAGQGPSNRFMFNMPSAVSVAVRGSERKGSTASNLSGLNNEPLIRKKGWLRKEGQRMKSWKRRYFVLEGTRLHYYENIGMKSLKGGGDVERVEVSDKHTNALDIYFRGGRVLHVVGDSAHDIRAWMETLQQANQVKPVTANPYNMLQRSSTMGSSGSDTTMRSTDNHTVDPLEFGRGWLLKEGKNFKTWKQRYFVLRERLLVYSRGTDEPSLGSGIVDHVSFSDARPFALNVQLSNGRLMTLVASIDDEFLMWCRAFKACFEYQGGNNSHMEDHAGIEYDSDNDNNEHDGDDDDEDEDEHGFVVDGDDDDDDIAILDDKVKGPALLKKMDSEIEDIDEIDGLSLGDRGEVTATFNADMVICSGWLRKQGGHIKSWKERYFTLYGTTLRYFKTENGPFIGGATIVHVFIIHTRKHSFEMTLENGRKMAVLAESEGEAERWIDALRRAISAAKEEKAALALANVSASPPRASSALAGGVGPAPVRPKITRAQGNSSLLIARSSGSTTTVADQSPDSGETNELVYQV